MILINSVGGRNTGLKGQTGAQKTWMKVRRNAERTRSDVGRLWGEEAGSKEKVFCIHSNSVCSLYGEMNKGNICLQTPKATTVCVDVFCCVFAYYYSCVFVRISACLSAAVRVCASLCVFVVVVYLL